MTLFERIVGARDWAAIPRLVIAAAVVVVAIELVVIGARDQHRLTVEGPYSVWLIVLPSVYVFLANRWFAVHISLLDEIGWDHDDAAIFLHRWRARIFSPSPAMIAVASVLTMAGIIAILPTPRMYASNAAILALLVGFGLVLATAGVFTVSIAVYVTMIWRIATTPVPDSPYRFLATSHPAFAAFERYWAWISVFSATAYFAVLVATTSAPPPGMPHANLWLWIAAIVPAAVVFLTLVMLHHVRSNVRARDEVASIKILRQSWEVYLHSRKSDDLARVSSLLSIFRSASADGGLSGAVRFVIPLLISLIPSVLKVLESNGAL